MKYELVLLLEKEEYLNEVKEILNSLKGKVIKEEKWGERNLAYPIKKLRKAFYYFLHLEIDKKNIVEIRKKLNFSNKILRYLLLVNNN